MGTGALSTVSVWPAGPPGHDSPLVWGAAPRALCRLPETALTHRQDVGAQERPSALQARPPVLGGAGCHGRIRGTHGAGGGPAKAGLPVSGRQDEAARVSLCPKVPGSPHGDGGSGS